LRDIQKKRIVLIDKKNSVCDGTGLAYIELSIESGKYKLYYLRIENEERIMPNSRLEVLG
jgi:hypothetical protein